MVDANRYATEWNTGRPGDESDPEEEGGNDESKPQKEKSPSARRRKARDGDSFDRTLSISAPKVGLGGKALGHAGPTAVTPEEIEQSALTKEQRGLLDRLMDELMPVLNAEKAKRGISTELKKGSVGAKTLQPGFHLTGDYLSLIHI